MTIRLNQYIQQNLGISRRKFVSLVQNGKLLLNNHLVESYSHLLKGGDVLEIKSMNIKKKIEKININFNVIIFNKPVGFVCSRNDKYNKTIYEILPKEFKNYFYVGRLDKDSRGLLILTDNGSLVDKLQHPNNNIEKEYIVKIDRNFSSYDYKEMKNGIIDEGELLKVKNAKSYKDKNNFFVKIILSYGKKRHIRRIFQNLGYKILDLQRIREGEFKLLDLKEGHWARVSV